MSDSSVVQDWLAENCTWKMQTVLLTSFRGCDGKHKHDHGKMFTRKMRDCILKNADVTTTFMNQESEDYDLTLPGAVDALKVFFDDMDHYPVHWFMHLLHAAEIVGYKHPDEKIREYWITFYLMGLGELHVGHEPESDLDARLKDKREGGEWNVKTDT